MSIEGSSFLGPTFSKINAIVSDGRSRRDFFGAAIEQSPLFGMLAE
jgi:hypothetical protein